MSTSIVSRGLRPIRTLLRLLLRRPVVGTSIVPLLPDGRIVLIRRRDTYRWALPGGIVDWGEDLATAAARELTEETGLTLTAIDRLVGVYSSAERDPRFHSICVALSAQATGKMQTYDPDEVVGVQAFLVEELPLEQLDHDHTQQLKDYLAGKIVLA
ncbi:NUDIX hydrolase [cf. Phormidesmis sp. LEGE 11477]|uniref:NUDIX hydrolase n=1 Tax=cf. Phormidesmis sp. LEGE 11477 TaxID=1828680 RepID=UPI0018808E03|nr:NUDIX hydrolase [cf. Phormidesmis sp. LEGE 11477]MBE9062814.1 NUDIX hydrolase [cf. Phormidesmis sp. LEGE 11477]